MKISFKIAVIVLLGVLLGICLTIFLVLPMTAGGPDLLKIFLIFVFAVIPPSFIVWFLIHKIVVKPILELNIISQVIARGDLSKRVRTKPIDEIGELSGNFNAVINNLTSGMQQLAYSLRDEKTKEKELAQNYQELNREKAKAEALLRSIGDAVIAVDDQKKIILFNEAASQMIGVTSITAMGQPYDQILKFLDEAGKKPAADFIASALTGEKGAENSRIMLETTNNLTVPVLQTTSTILRGENKISGVIIVLKDITQEKELEKLKDEFVSLASHELRTPMTAIKGLISMIFEGDYGAVNETLKDPLSDIAKSTQRLIELVNDMLDVSRIESGRTKITISAVSIPELVAEIVGMLKPLADQKKIQLGVNPSIQSAQDKVNADPDKVKQILINLINNAIKFTDSGNVAVSFRPQGKFAYISVTDSGVGITREDQSKLFGKFSQISTSQLGRPPGTGLGLYISKEFAEKMGGELWLERSESNQGSTFTFSLPFVNNML